jgi:heme/copper-type cytochrome/quinol oxidase subunit 2
MVLHMMDMLHLVGAVEQGVLAHAVSMVLTVTDGQQVHHPVVTEVLVWLMPFLVLRVITVVGVVGEQIQMPLTPLLVG